MKFRWSLVALLLLLPLTMAPKIALVPGDDQPLQITASFPRETVRAGTPVTIHFIVENVGDETMSNVEVTTQLLIADAEASTVSIVRASGSCDISEKGDSATCQIGDLDAGDTDRYRLTVLPQAPGTLTFDVAPTADAGFNAGTVPVDEFDIEVR